MTEEELRKQVDKLFDDYGCYEVCCANFDETEGNVEGNLGHRETLKAAVMSLIKQYSKQREVEARDALISKMLVNNCLTSAGQSYVETLMTKER